MRILSGANGASKIPKLTKTTAKNSKSESNLKAGYFLKTTVKPTFNLQSIICVTKSQAN